MVYSAIATNDIRSAIAATSTGWQCVRRCTRSWRGSGTRVTSSSRPFGAGGTSASSLDGGSPLSTTDRMGDDETAGTVTPVDDETDVVVENHRPLSPKGMRERLAGAGLLAGKRGWRAE